jgi:uncharacterized membrane protein
MIKSTFIHGLRWSVMTLLAIGITVYVVTPYLSFNPAKSLIPLQANFRPHFTWLLLHVLASSVALAIGPFQFLPILRRRWPALHRNLGRVYLVAVLIGGVSGLVNAVHSQQAGLVGRTGLALVGVLWLYTVVMAYTTIRQGRVREHAAWMTRNYALTFAGVNLRVELNILIMLLAPHVNTLYGGNFQALVKDVYELVTWLSWVPNLVVAQWLTDRPAKVGVETVLSHSGSGQKLA